MDLGSVTEDWRRRNEPYLERFPVAVVEKDGRVVAFANLWPGAGGIKARRSWTWRPAGTSCW